MCDSFRSVAGMPGAPPRNGRYMKGKSIELLRSGLLEPWRGPYAVKRTFFMPEVGSPAQVRLNVRLQKQDDEQLRAQIEHES